MRHHLLRASYQATQKLRGYLPVTPCLYSAHLSRLSGARVYLKCENLQATGSFKVRCS
ncbi:MAG: hypothetical protein R2880_04065 [Deinococcales bacterium]